VGERREIDQRPAAVVRTEDLHQPGDELQPRRVEALVVEVGELERLELHPLSPGPSRSNVAPESSERQMRLSSSTKPVAVDTVTMRPRTSVSTSETNSARASARAASRSDRC